MILKNAVFVGRRTFPFHTIGMQSPSYDGNETYILCSGGDWAPERNDLTRWRQMSRDSQIGSFPRSQNFWFSKSQNWWVRYPFALVYIYTVYKIYPKYPDPSKLAILRTLPLLYRFNIINMWHAFRSCSSLWVAQIDICMSTRRLRKVNFQKTSHNI